MRISDWSSDVCSSDLKCIPPLHWRQMVSFFRRKKDKGAAAGKAGETRKGGLDIEALAAAFPKPPGAVADDDDRAGIDADGGAENRSEEHTSELQSLMRISYAVFCLKKKTKNT